MREQDIQNQIRVALSDYGLAFRTNSGDFWQGDVKYDPRLKQNILVNLRRVAGLPDGFSDLVFFSHDGKAAFIEVKTARGRVEPEQEKFIELMRSKGYQAGIARSVQDALQIIGKGDEKID